MSLTPAQKKVLGIILIIIFIPVLLLFFAVFIGNLFSEKDAVTQFSPVFVMGLFFFPLWLGFSLWKAGGAPPPVTEISSDRTIKLSAKIEKSEYRKLIYYLTYTNPIFIFIHFIGLCMLPFYIIGGDANWFVLFITLFLLYLPISIYRSSTSNYKATKAIHETQLYEFTPENIIVTGESFNCTIQWRTLHKVKETKNWFLLYTNKQTAMLIPKKNFGSPSDLDEFRGMTQRVAAQ